MPRERSHMSSRRRSSSSASGTSPDRHKIKSKRRRRSRSRDSESSTRRRRRSASRSRRSRSHSRDRYVSKSKKRSASRTRSKKSSRRSTSRSRGRSRSSSRDKYRSVRSGHKKSSRRRSRSSDSRSSASSSESYRSLPKNIGSRKVNLDDTESKLEKAIKAAEAAGLTMTKLPTYEYKDVPVKEDMPTIQDRNLLQELNSDAFVSKPFVSSRSKKFAENIVIDLDTQTVKIPEVDIKEDDSLLKLDELPSEEELKEMWIKKLYLYRKKMLKGEIS